VTRRPPAPKCKTVPEAEFKMTAIFMAAFIQAADPAGSQ
jgi:hypothetical protein